ncbi:MAG: hypothetical protein J1F03_00740, partial [Oscillospiraceae bacterium]|nr:hypothetical protein [Oscillospiraceae bacterium]
MSNEEKRKKPNKGKVAFMFAFAVTVLGSRAGAMTASAAVNPGDDANNNNGDGQSQSQQNEIGSKEGYLKCGSNVYIASEEASAVKGLNNSLSGLKGFAAYTKDLNMYGIHVEGNICAETVNKFDVFNTNVADNFVKNNVDGFDVYTCYIAQPPQDGGDIIKVHMYEGTSYELVLGFDFEERFFDNGNQLGFSAGGKDYKIECEDKNRVTIRRATVDDKFADISGNLDLMAKAGQALINEVGYSADESGNSLEDAVFAIESKAVKPGQTIVASVHCNDLRSNGSYIEKLLTDNGGVNVIINVITDADTNYVDMGVANNGVNWNLSNANVTFNFGDYAGDVKASQMGGLIVAPNAHFFNDGVLSGSIFASDVKMNNEIHQITPDDGTVSSSDDEDQDDDQNVQDSEEDEESDEDDSNKNVDEDVVEDNGDDDDGGDDDETTGGDGGDDDTDNDGDDTDDTTPDDGDDDDSEDKVVGEDPSIETDDDDGNDNPPDDNNTDDGSDEETDVPDDTTSTGGDNNEDEVIDDTPDDPQTPDEPETPDTPDDPQT